MISLSQTWYGSGRVPAGARHGNLRRWRSYQPRRGAGSGVRVGGKAGIGRMGSGEANRLLNAPKLADRMAESERHPGFRAVGVAVSKLAVPIIGKRGGGILVRLKADWAEIIGREWAEVTW